MSMISMKFMQEHWEAYHPKVLRPYRVDLMGAFFYVIAVSEKEASLAANDFICEQAKIPAVPYGFFELKEINSIEGLSIAQSKDTSMVLVKE